jgi:hypothetical protein
MSTTYACHACKTNDCAVICGQAPNAGDPFNPVYWNPVTGACQTCEHAAAFHQRNNNIQH